MQKPHTFLSLSRPITCLVVLSFYVTSAPTPAHLALFVVGSAFFLASSAILVDWIPVPEIWTRRVLWAELALAALLTYVGGQYVPGGPMQILFMPILISFGISLPSSLSKRALLIAAGVWALSSLPGWLQPDSYAFIQFGLFGGMMMFGAATGRLIRSLGEEKLRSEELLQQVNQSRAALERTHRQLQETAASQQAMAVVEERQRLAREIHDSVAHGLTSLVVQTQVARRLLERSPEQAADVLARCEAMARDALQETRRAVRALHPSGLEQQHDADALERLGRDFGIATGIAVIVTADQAARALPPDPHRLEQLYRIFQEALTNAHRHGQAGIVTAALSVDGEQLCLRISNNGTPPSRLDPGVGLKSMEERAHLLGGSARFTPDVMGLTIDVRVPIRQQEVSA